MKEILILCTSWGEGDYWGSDRVAPYPKRSIVSIQALRNSLPLAGIGVYIKQKERDFRSKPPCFISVKGISENEKGEPQFDIHFIARIEKIRSSDLSDEIGTSNLFFNVPQERILGVLSKFGIESPSEWRALLEEKPELSWQDWIGKYYLDILKPVSNQEYEDKIADIFTALGFEVDQIGYKRKGEYPDGIVYSQDYAIIYDCKNRFDFFVDSKDKRAMIDYINWARSRIEEKRRAIKNVFFAFIAHSYNNVEKTNDIEKETSIKGLLLTSEASLYLLFKKLSLGRLFLMTDFKEMVSNQVITKDIVERVYGKGSR